MKTLVYFSCCAGAGLWTWRGWKSFAGHLKITKGWLKHLFSLLKVLMYLTKVYPRHKDTENAVSLYTFCNVNLIANVVDYCRWLTWKNVKSNELGLSWLTKDVLGKKDLITAVNSATQIGAGCLSASEMCLLSYSGFWAFLFQLWKTLQILQYLWSSFEVKFNVLASGDIVPVTHCQILSVFT